MSEWDWDAFEKAGQALMERIAARNEAVAMPSFKRQTKEYREDLAFLIEAYNKGAAKK